MTRQPPRLQQLQEPPSDEEQTTMSGIPRSTVSEEVAKLGGALPIARYKKSPEQLCGELLGAFAASVESQLAEGQVSADEQTAIVRVMESTDLAIRDDIAEAILKLEAEEEAGKQAAKLRSEFAKSRGALARRLKWSILEYLKEKGITRVSSEEHLFRVTKNPTRTIIKEAVLPDEWKKDETKRVPDRAKIEAALDTGQEVPGASYEQSLRLDVK